MYRKAVNYLRGQAAVEITSSAPERVVNLCAAHGIPFWDVDWRTERCFRVTTTLPGLRRLRQVTGGEDAKSEKIMQDSTITAPPSKRRSSF